MAKKSKDEAPNPNSVANRDIIQRLNFLYQASQLLGSMAQEIAPVHKKSVQHGAARRAERKDNNKRRHPTTIADLSRSYVRSMQAIGQKTNVRIGPSVKRTLCKECKLVLVPGTTAIVRVNSSKSHRNTVVYTCTACQTSRNIPAPPVHDPSAPAESSQATGSADAGPSIADQEASHNVAALQEGYMMPDGRDTHPATGKPGSRIRPRRAKAIFSRPSPFFE